MAEQHVEEISLNIKLQLADYLALQMWIRQQNVVRNFFIYVVSMFSFMIFIGLVSGMSRTNIIQNLSSQWRFYILLILGVYFLSTAVVFIVIGVSWIRNKLPREMRVSITNGGLTYSMDDQGANFRWSNLLFVTENRSAYFVRLKNTVVRLPKRAFAPQQFVTFEKILGANVAASAIRIVRN